MPMAASGAGTPVAEQRAPNHPTTETMSIARLEQVARQKLPLNISDADEVDELRVLMAEGLIAALPVRAPAHDGSAAGRRMVRVLAITPDGRRLLQRSAANLLGARAAGSSQPMN